MQPSTHYSSSGDDESSENDVQLEPRPGRKRSRTPSNMTRSIASGLNAVIARKDHLDRGAKRFSGANSESDILSRTGSDEQAKEEATVDSRRVVPARRPNPQHGLSTAMRDRPKDDTGLHGGVKRKAEDDHDDRNCNEIPNKKRYPDKFYKRLPG